MTRHHALNICLIALLGCATAPLEREPELGEASDALSGFHAALDHGEAWFGTRVEAELTAKEPAHSWTFELPTSATVTVSTQGTATGPDLDTVLYLYHGEAKS